MAKSTIRKVNKTEQELKQEFEQSNFSTVTSMPDDLPDNPSSTVVNLDPSAKNNPRIIDNGGGAFVPNPNNICFVSPFPSQWDANQPNFNNSNYEGMQLPIEGHNQIQIPNQQQPAQPTHAQKTREQIYIDKFRQDLLQYQKTLLPKFLKAHNISADQFGLAVLNYLKEDDAILKAFIANPTSMFASVFAAAEVGIIPTKRSGEFYFIPRNLKQPDGSYKLTVCPQIGYIGLVKILQRSDKVLHVNANIVYECDEFIPTYGLNPTIIHKPNLDGDRSAAKIKYAYAYVNFKNGTSMFHVVTRKEIEAIRALQKEQNYLYFNDKIGINRWMEKKIALVQLSKLIPKDYYHTASMAIINSVDGGGSVSLDEENNLIFNDNPENGLNRANNSPYGK